MDATAENTTFASANIEIFFQSIEGDVIPRVSSADVRIENRFGCFFLIPNFSSVVVNSREPVNGEDCNL